MFQDLLVGLALTMFEVVVVLWVRLCVVAVLEQGLVSLNVAGCAAAPRRGETDVGRHGVGWGVVEDWRRR